jgi:hypothetical protein
MYYAGRYEDFVARVIAKKVRFKLLKASMNDHHLGNYQWLILGATWFINPDGQYVVNVIGFLHINYLSCKTVKLTLVISSSI